MTNIIPYQVNGTNYYTGDQAEEIILYKGLTSSKATVRDWIRDGLLGPVTRIGRTILIHDVKLAEFIKSRKGGDIK